MVFLSSIRQRLLLRRSSAFRRETGFVLLAFALVAPVTAVVAESSQTPSFEVVETVENLELERFRANYTINEFANVPFEVNLQNTGESELEISGQIIVKNWFGQRSAVVPLPAARAIKPGESALLKPVWLKPSLFGFGRYRAYLEVAYGSRGKIMEGVSFWVLPLKTIGSTVTASIALYFIFAFWVGKLSTKLLGKKRRTR